MKLEFFPWFGLVGLAILGVGLARLWRRKARPAYLAACALFGLYLLLLIGVTLFPIPLTTGSGAPLARQSAAYIFGRINFAPFDYSRYTRINPGYLFWREIVANILMTMPFGFGFCTVTRWRAWHMLWLAPALGLGIETAQLGMDLALGTYYRGVDVSDAVLNGLGVLCGYACYRWLATRVLRRFGW